MKIKFINQQLNKETWTEHENQIKKQLNKETRTEHENQINKQTIK